MGASLLAVAKSIYYISRAQFRSFRLLDFCNFPYLLWSQDPFDNSVYYTDGVILYKHYYYHYY